MSAALKGGSTAGFVGGCVCYMVKDYKNQGIKGEDGIRTYIVDPKYAVYGSHIGATIGLVTTAYYI